MGKVRNSLGVGDFYINNLFMIFQNKSKDELFEKQKKIAEIKRLLTMFAWMIL